MDRKVRIGNIHLSVEVVQPLLTFSLEINSENTLAVTVPNEVRMPCLLGCMD